MLRHPAAWWTRKHHTSFNYCVEYFRNTCHTFQQVFMFYAFFVDHIHYNVSSLSSNGFRWDSAAARIHKQWRTLTKDLEHWCGCLFMIKGLETSPFTSNFGGKFAKYWLNKKSFIPETQCYPILNLDIISSTFNNFIAFLA